MEMMARTDIISIELVNSYECTGRREPEAPGEERTQDRELAFMQVVGENGVELFHSKNPNAKPGSVSERDFNPETETETEMKSGNVGNGRRGGFLRSLTHPDVRMDDQD
jgi:hypothetical protein